MDEVDVRTALADMEARYCALLARVDELEQWKDRATVALNLAAGAYQAIN